MCLSQSCIFIHFYCFCLFLQLTIFCIVTYLQLADKESFVVTPPTEDSALKESDPTHPFPKKSMSTRKHDNKSATPFTDDTPLSPDSLSNVSTLTGTESVQHPFSDSDGDSDIENYRIKSILRGKDIPFPWGRVLFLLFYLN